VVRTVALLSIVMLAVAGCGGNGGAKASHSVVQVSKAFYDAQIPFTSVVTSNPYIAGQGVSLPESLNTSDLALDVLAQLTGSLVSTRTAWIGWVFDTDARAQQALKQVPLQRWGQGATQVDRFVKGNVIIVATGFTGVRKKSLDAALAKLG
jgi:hypothetical protein